MWFGFLPCSLRIHPSVVWRWCGTNDAADDRGLACFKFIIEFEMVIICRLCTSRSSFLMVFSRIIWIVCMCMWLCTERMCSRRDIKQSSSTSNWFGRRWAQNLKEEFGGLDVEMQLDAWIVIWMLNFNFVYRSRVDLSHQSPRSEKNCS